MEEFERPEFWLKQGREASQTSDWEEAYRFFLKANSLAPSSRCAKIGMARCLLAQGRAQEAVGHLQQIDSPQSDFLRAVAYLQNGQRRRGIATMMATLERMDPRQCSEPAPRPALLWALTELQYPAGAGDARTWTCRAVLLTWLERGPEAFACLSEALRTTPGFQPAHRLQDLWLSQLLCLPAPKEATESTTSVDSEAHSHEVEPRPEWYIEHLLDDDGEALYRAAEEMAVEGRWPETLEYLRRLMMVEPNQLEGCRLRFEALLEVGRGDEALREGYHLMDLLERAGAAESASLHGERMAHVWPGDQRVLLKNALFYHRLKDANRVAEWTFRLVACYLEDREPDRAAASLLWLLRLPISNPVRVEAELRLIEVLLINRRTQPAVARLDIYLTQWEMSALVGDQTYTASASAFRTLLEQARNVLEHHLFDALRQRAERLAR